MCILCIVTVCCTLGEYVLLSLKSEHALSCNVCACVCVCVCVCVFQLFVLRAVGGESIGAYVVLLIVTGILINGPYGIITTAVSSDLVNICVCVGV